MNDMTPAAGTALTLPASTDLAILFKSENGLDPIISQLEAAARAEAASLNADTAKGRDAIKSLAHKVSLSKAEMDRQGKALTEQQRQEIAAVNAGRKVADDRLSALRDEIRKPVTDWEAAEKARKDQIEVVLKELRNHGMTAEHSSDAVMARAGDVKALGLRIDLGDQREQVEMVREAALTGLRQLYTAAKTREDQAAELEALRAEKAERERLDAERQAKEQADREAREAAERAEQERVEAETQAKREAEEAEKRRQEAAARMEREKAEAAEQARKDAEAKAERDRIEAESRAKAEAERIQREADERAAAERHAAAEREAALQRQIELQQRETEAAAQRERDRIAAEQKAESEARAKREADQAHRAKIAADISAALTTMAGRATPDNIAAALLDGKIPHCTVRI